MARPGACSVGYGGPYAIPADGMFDPGTRDAYHIYWLPAGYAPHEGARCLCVIRPPEGEDWDGYGLGRGERAPLIEAVCAAIEAHMLPPPPPSE